MRTDILLVTPRNDEESLQILKIAEAFNLPHLVSNQPHGARLHKEPKLVESILNAEEAHVAVVENPSLEAEARIESGGKTLHLIDHHRYEEFNRMKEESSLEQFLDLFGIVQQDLQEAGFEPLMVMAVAAIDRGFVWELRKLNYSQEDYKRALDYYKALTIELGDEGRIAEEEAALKAYAGRHMEGDYLVIEQEEDTPDIRSSLSFLIARDYKEEPPQAIIRQGSARIYLQDSPRAKELHDHFGGFTFGQDLCWGKSSEDSKERLPTVEDVLGILQA